MSEGEPRASPASSGMDGGHLPGHLSYQALSAGHPPSPGTLFPEGQVDSLLSIISSQRERFRARNQELEGVRRVGKVASGGCRTCSLELAALMTCREFISSTTQSAPLQAREKSILLLAGPKPPPAPRCCSSSRTGPNPCCLARVLGRLAQHSGVPYKKHVGNVVRSKNPIALQIEVQLKMTSLKPAGWLSMSCGAWSQPKAAHSHPGWPFFGHGGIRFVNGSGLEAPFSSSWDNCNLGAILIQSVGF